MIHSPHAAVVCAAGAGTRMGSPKALCLLDSRSFLQSIVETLHACNIQTIIVVVGAQAERVIQFHKNLGMDNVTFVINPLWASTFMLESLLCGLNYVPGDHAVLHWPVDCLDVHPDDLMALLQHTEPLASLVYDGLLAHPMRISPDAANYLRQNAHSFSSLRDFTSLFGITPVQSSHPALMNCNTPLRLQEYIQNSLIKKAH